MMSSKGLIRQPTWSGLQPALPEWVHPPGEMVRYLNAIVGFSGDFLSAKFGERVSTHIFRLELECGEHVIIKLVEPDGRVRAEEAEQVAHWLHCNEVSVVSASEMRLLCDGRLMLRIPYLEGQQIELTHEALGVLGRDLAKFHQVLIKAPYRKFWDQKTQSRLKSLSHTREFLVETGGHYGPDPERLLQLASNWSLDFTHGVLPSQPLHGDLNPGNVLYVDGQVVFLDFEDVVHSVLPLEYEVLFAIERFVLVREQNDIEAVLLGREFLHGYFSDDKCAIRKISKKAIDILRSLSLRSLMVLAHGESSGIMISDDEWNKFFYLENQARVRADVIQSIFEGH